ncbi:MAG: DNA-binding response regulator [Haliscomenobacteraceae bacterium CHB4]|nr:Transcriptional regulatory protein BtsR [Saprospiraceae bacterium]MCE7923788.1 DNA-binding response regulator [Haliscomenobacteraceae bacterium CHB4]
MMKAVIIDDEPGARSVLQLLLRTCAPDVIICGEANNALQGAAVIAQCCPDVVFLDIDLGDGSGFDLLEIFPSPHFAVIFITAHDEFAITAFRYNALDYLLKPINSDDLAAAVARLSRQTHPDAYSGQLHNLRENYRDRRLERIVFPGTEGHFFVQLEEIVHIRSEGNYTYVTLTNGTTHFAARSIKEFEELLPSDHFIRTHQSHIVNINSIRLAAKTDGLVLHLNNGAVAPVSRRKQDEVVEILGLNNRSKMLRIA